MGDRHEKKFLSSGFTLVIEKIWDYLGDGGRKRILQPQKSEVIQNFWAAGLRIGF